MKHPCPYCRGTGTVKTPDTPCEGVIVVGHERIGCFALRGHPGEPHMAILNDPCPECRGYDSHAAGCPATGDTTDRSDWYSWRDRHGSLTLVDYESGREWHRRYQADPLSA